MGHPRALVTRPARTIHLSVSRPLKLLGIAPPSPPFFVSKAAAPGFSSQLYLPGYFGAPPQVWAGAAPYEVWQRDPGRIRQKSAGKVRIRALTQIGPVRDPKALPHALSKLTGDPRSLEPKWRRPAFMIGIRVLTCVDPLPPLTQDHRGHRASNSL